VAISKTKNSPYYYTRFSICGVRVQETTRCTSKREAQEYEEKRRREIRQQFLLGRKPTKTWAEAVLRWLKEMEHKRSILSDIVHFRWLQDHLNRFELKDITKEVIEKIAQRKEELGAKPATVNRILALIRAVLMKAYKYWEWIDRVPVVRMRVENNARIRWLTKEEAARLLKQLPPHLGSMAKFTLATGLRASNVLNLEWKDINLPDRHLVIHPENNKSKKALGIPLNQDAIEVLEQEKGKHAKAVFTFKGKPVASCNTKAWKAALKRAEIENFRWHDLRHTWASWHVQSGTTLQELFELGGWSSFEMVLRYAHLSSNQLKKAADRIQTGEGMVK
jgi:integrase